MAGTLLCGAAILWPHGANYKRTSPNALESHCTTTIGEKNGAIMTADTDQWLTYLKQDSGPCKKILLWRLGHISDQTEKKKKRKGFR